MWKKKNKAVMSLIMSTDRSSNRSEIKYISRSSAVYLYEFHRRGWWSFRHHVCDKTSMEKANTPRWYYRFIFYFFTIWVVCAFFFASIPFDWKTWLVLSQCGVTGVTAFCKIGSLYMYTYCTAGVGRRQRRDRGRIIKIYIYRWEKHIMY